MFVITADQVNSREEPDAVRGMIARLTADIGDALPLPPDRSAGDEMQVLVPDAGIALRAILQLTRAGGWSVGLGIGSVREPLGTSIRESTGPAFIAARGAVERAKAKPSRFAVEGEDARPEVADTEALIDLLLLLRARRTAEGWELHDLLSEGLTQGQAAKRLGITPQAASDRARAAELRAEAAVTPALVRLLGKLEGDGS